jgi:hypothetical protein
MTALANRYAAELLNALPHAPRLSNGPDPRPHRDGKAFLLSCTCLAGTGRRGHRGYEVIEARTLFPAADAKAAWRAWHRERGVTV